MKPGWRKLLSTDFSDVEHGIDALAEACDADERRSIGDALLREFKDIQGWDFPAMAEFRRAVSEVQSTGGDVEPVRVAFRKIVFACSGWSATKMINQAHRAVHAQRSAKGGTAAAETKADAAADRDAALQAALDAERSRNPRLSAADLAARLSERGFGGKEYLRKKILAMIRAKNEKSREV
jgi:hypothetical protein